MNFRITITARALSDLKAIRDFISMHSPDNAAKFIEKTLAEFDVIEASPESFSRAPEDNSVPYTLRQVVIKPYRILFTVTGHRVEILHIRHGGRSPAGPDELR